MSIKIISVGKKHDPWIIDGIERYQKRLRRPFDVEWVFSQHSAYDGLKARQDDSKRILLQLMPDDYVILLDEVGKNISSLELSRVLTSQVEISQKVVIIIGGAYGVDESVHKRADFVWSLSKLVFPHQLVRLLLIEQLYRAQEIALNHPYHHV